jgi:ornithine carbamoyltransferase
MSHHFLAGHTLPDDLRQNLLRSAQGLKRASQDHRALRPLAGRHVAIACPDPARHESDPVERAATSLGARVSYISLDALNFPPEQHALARMLGSLYDVIDCSALSPERARELQRLASIPVFDGLACAERPLRQLLPALAGTADGDGKGSDEENLNTLLQAALIEALA